MGRMRRFALLKLPCQAARRTGGQMRELNIRNVTLMALIASCFLQVGAQLFAISIMASTIAEAPPRSLAILEGEYGYDSSAFWSTVPPVTGLLFIIALVANWKTPRRTHLLASFGLFLIAGVAAGVLLEPEFAAITATGYSDKVDPALQSRAAKWLAYDWAVWGISLACGFALLLALLRPVSSKQE
jgi:hypothetical protein